MTTVFAPYAAANPMGTAAPARVFDPRLGERGVVIQGAVAAAGQAYWRLVVARWFSESEAGGRHHLYVEARDEGGQLLSGVPFRVTWPTGVAIGQTKAGAGFDAGNYPLSPSRNEFAATIYNGLPSDVVTGIGMGADTPGGFNSGIHTSTLLVFQRTTYGGEPIPPPAEPPPPPLPPTPDPVLDALAVARHILETARQAIDTATELYSRQARG